MAESHAWKLCSVHPGLRLFFFWGGGGGFFLRSAPHQSKSILLLPFWCCDSCFVCTDCRDNVLITKVVISNVMIIIMNVSNAYKALRFKFLFGDHYIFSLLLCALWKAWCSSHEICSLSVNLNYGFFPLKFLAILWFLIQRARELFAVQLSKKCCFFQWSYNPVI